MRDITEHKRLEAELKNSEERYRLMFETAPEPIAIHSEGRLVAVNDAAVRLAAAKDASEIIGRSIFDFIHPDCHQEVMDRMRAVSIPAGFCRLWSRNTCAWTARFWTWR